MKKLNKTPHEQSTEDGIPVNGEGVRAPKVVEDDVQAHRAGVVDGDGVGTRLPGTGGDYRRPSGGGELTEDDVEGHKK